MNETTFSGDNQGTYMVNLTPDNPLIQHHKEVFDECIEISRAKCKDYAGDEDPLLNFRLCEYLGVCSTETGILVRLCDKISRTAKVMRDGNQVKGETIKDTILDSINYDSILLYSIKERALEENKKIADRYSKMEVID